MWKAIPLVLTLIAVGQTANQAAAEPMEIRCGNTDVSLRERIAGCTAIIDGGQNLGRELSQAYAQRGLAYTMTRDLARAGEDVEKAAQIDPSNVTAWTTRANYF
jgi:Tfp pilus assembly protein PilF